MNIEQPSYMQVLNKEDYTKVYGGGSHRLLSTMETQEIMPVGELKPKKPGTRALHHEPFHTGIFGS